MFEGKMIKAIVGKKLKMTQIFDKEGRPIPVTLIEVDLCYVTQIKTEERDGYNAVQLGFGKAKRKLKSFREFRVKNSKELEGFNLGDVIDVSVFKESDKAIVSGISKGKGFQGVIKRWGFRRGPETHGSNHHRHPGSIGSMFPQRVIKGKKMPGHMGSEKVTIKGTKIVKIIPETNILMLKGAIPGSRKSIISIQVVS